MPPPLTVSAFSFEILLALSGCVVLWRHVLSPAARQNRRPSPLPPWDPEPVQFVIFLGLLFAGTFVFAAAASMLVKRFHLVGDPAAIVAGAAAQFGMLAGALSYAATDRNFRRQHTIGLRATVTSGGATFLASLPILYLVSFGWEQLLQRFGLPAEPQDLIRMFAEAKSKASVAILLALAVVIAPVTEELIFRAGLFRFLHSRLPRLVALLVPALIFASLHVSWGTLEGFASWLPLVALAVVFSLAYERTGNIGTTIVAHGLFNLNTIVLIFCGVAS